MVVEMKKFKKTKNDRPTDKELDKLWAEVCRARDGNYCVYHKELFGRHCCEILQVHHINKKCTNRLRWEVSSGITICRAVHFSIAHSQKPIQENQFREWALGRLPQKEREKLVMFQNAVGGVDRFALKIYLQQQLKKFLAMNKTEEGAG